MSGPVDVLAWLDAKVERELEIERATGLPNNAREPAIAVRAAVAELAEACKERDAARVVWNCLEDDSRQYPGSEYQRLRAAEARYADALANIGGAK